MKRFFVTLRIFGIIFLFLSALSLSAAPIDQIYDELLKDPAFQAADGEMSKVYGFVRTKMDAEKQAALRDAQRKWLVLRDSAILSVPASSRVAVALAQTRARTEFLTSYLVKSLAEDTNKKSVQPTSSKVVDAQRATKPNGAAANASVQGMEFGEKRRAGDVKDVKNKSKKNDTETEGFELGMDESKDKLAVLPSFNGVSETDLEAKVNDILSRESNLVNFVSRDVKFNLNGGDVYSNKIRLQESINAYGPDSIEAATSYNNLGVALLGQVQFYEAEKAIKEALRITRSRQGTESPAYAMNLNVLASLYGHPMVSNFEDSLPLRFAAINALKKLKKTNEYYDTIQDLGLNYLLLGDLDTAISLLSSVHAYHRKVGRGQASLLCLLAIGECHLRKGNASVAESCFREALTCDSTSLGHNIEPKERLNAFKISLEDYLALSLVRQGKADSAAVLNARHLKLLGNSNSPGASCYIRTAGEIAFAQQRFSDSSRYFSRAFEMQKKMVTENAVDFMKLQELLIRSLILEGNKPAALSISDLWRKATEANMRRIVRCGTESQRLAFTQQSVSFDIPAAIFDARRLADTIVRWKGYVVDSIVSDQKKANLATEKLSKNEAAEFRALKGELLSVEIALCTQKSEILDSRRRDLNGRILALERKLFTRGRELIDPSNADVSDASSVQRSMGADTVVVEFFDYVPIATNNARRMCGAVIISPENEPARVDLGDLEALEAVVLRYNSLISSEGAVDKEILSLSKELSEKLWKPIVNFIPRTASKIILSPTGQLNFLSFSSLVDSADRFISEKYLISYISSSRDMLASGLPREKGNLVVFSDPSFSSQSSAGAPVGDAVRGSKADDTKKISFRQLAGTKREGEEIVAIAANHGLQAVSFAGDDASKRHLTDMAAPAILHLATHGFFLGSEVSTSGPGSSRGMLSTGSAESAGPEGVGAASLSLKAFHNSPMRQGGIALAFAQDTVDAWAKGQLVNSENNGILTAEEVALLDLNKTWLVVLSACETGVGKSRSGEGVFGLRRAFMIAGAENLVMTLWPVADETTASIISDFYAKALSTGKAWESLAEVQRDWLVKLRKEKGLQTAVRDAGPFAMAVMVNPAKSGWAGK